MLSIIIPVKNQLFYTKNILEEIKQKVKSDHEIIIINDNSTDWTDEYLSSLEWITYIKSETDIGVNKAWNIWVEKAQWDYIWIINNDLTLTDWIDLKLINWFDDETDIVCPVSTTWPNKFELPIIVNDNNIAWRCFMLKDKSLFPIDERLDIWYGDDWLYMKSKKE